MDDPDLISKFDNNPLLYPILHNKVINLLTQEIRDRNKDDYFTFECPVEWNPTANQDSIRLFFNQIMLGDTDMIELLQIILGYSITGYTDLNKFFIFFGSGGNGKTALMNLIKGLLGKYYCQSDDSVFIKKRSPSAGAANPFLYDLKGKRIVCLSETEKGDAIMESQIKNFTGGDFIKTRNIFEGAIEFRPNFKCFILTNNLPRISTDQALWNRLIAIKFRANFVDNPTKENEYKRDVDFFHSLSSPENRSAFLNWLLEGCKLWFTERKLNLPERVKRTILQYKKEIDIIGRFIEDCCDILNPEGLINSTTLYNTYKNWCRTNGLRHLSHINFSKDMVKRYSKIRRSAGIYFKGLTLLTTFQDVVSF